MTTFGDAVLPVKQQYMRRRVSAFARKNNVTNDDVEVIDEMDLSSMEKEFKRNNGIKVRLYKNMTEEQKQAWVLYYNDHKQLSLRVKGNTVTETKPLPKPKRTQLVQQSEEDEHVEKQDGINDEPLKPAKHRRTNSHVEKINEEVKRPRKITHHKKAQQTTDDP